MADLPNITRPEVVTVAAAVLLLFVVPMVLAWSDDRKRRRIEALQAAALSEMPAEAPAVDAASHSDDAFAIPPANEPDITAVVAPPPPPSDASAVSAWEEPAPSPPPLAVPPSEVETETTVAVPPEPRETPPTAGVLRPLEGSWKHEFRLADLHAATLPDWPPSAIRSDPGRLALWREAERVAEQYTGAITQMTVCSPYPARSRCLGAAASDGSNLQLRFLLFPVLWPVSQNQAVAQAVFQIDRVSGEVHGWVDPLRPQELTAENRREILEGGGTL